MSRFLILIAVAAGALLTGCTAQKQSDEKRAEAVASSDAAVAEFKRRDPGIEKRLKSAYGYAIFPSVGKGAIGVGGARGEGVVFEQGEAIGNTVMTQATIGFQLGGQAYRELIIFEDKKTLDDFTSGNFQLAAQVSAVAATAGASANADFRNGMMIFTMQVGGLMYEASVGGQKFSFRRY